MSKQRGVLPANPDPYVAFEERMKRLYAADDLLKEMDEVEREIFLALLRDQKLAAMRG